ncbi:MAG: N-formylglutamate amidohydrolase [Acetobacteraceae bacterium]|nr:N-formylglutamate amidohydrolase [Acetobacteraceae bacterium]
MSPSPPRSARAGSPAFTSSRTRWPPDVTTRRLLAEDEPSPVSVLNPEGRSDFVLTADHAGRLIPRRLGDLDLPEHELTRHIAWDIGIAGVTERLSAAFDAPAVFQLYSRLVIDCNRGHGVDSSIPTISETTAIPGNTGLSAEDRADRQREIFAPYHGAIRALLDARAKANKRTLLIAMHSFTPVFKGEQRRTEIGVLFNRDNRLARALLDVLHEEGDIVVGENDPYTVTDLSDYGIPMHGERRGIPHVELEIRQDLIGTPQGERHWADRLARLLPLADDRMSRAL